MSEFKVRDIEGSGGGGGGGGGGGKASGGNEAYNTLRSNAVASLVELLGEGEIAGLVNGGQSIYFNETPVVNANNTVNFRGVQWEERTGLPDQAGIPGNATAESVTQVGVQVQFSVPPTVVTIVDAEATMARVVVRVPALYESDKSGNVKPTSVVWQVEVQPNGGAWQMVDLVELINQKCNSPYQQQSVFSLPPGGNPWNIRVVRLTMDSTTSSLQNETWWDTYTSVVTGNFTYPNSAVVHLKVDAELFNANSIPTRSFHVKGLLIQIPSNYDPVARTYTGIWDGTFQKAYSNNPAWVLYDLLTSNRYGIGDFIDATKIDKWGLYTIAQYCDETVADGYGGHEPRYVFNGVLNNRQDAFKAIQSVTATFRGMSYWATGQVFATADMPMDPVKLVSPSNVLDGRFNYSGTSLKSRHSVALVRWNDPNAFYAPTVEVVVNEEQLVKFGWRETQISALGCTSRGQANRMGRWALDTEQYSTETVEYTAAFDHIDVRPGDVIAVADPSKANIRTGGRLTQVIDAFNVVMDQLFSPVAGETYTMMVEYPDGTVGNLPVSKFSNGDQTVTLSAAMTQLPIVGAMWIIVGSEVAPRQYRVLSVEETDKHQFKVTALFYDPTKYARVELAAPLATIQYSQPKSTIDPPANIKVNETVFYQNGVAHNRVTISWTPSNDFMAKGYLVTGAGPQGGTTNFGQTNTASLDIDDPALGGWTFFVQSVGYDGRVSPYASVQFNVQGWASMPPPYVSLLEVFGQGADTSFAGQDCHVSWQNNFPGSTTDLGQGDVGVANQSPFYLSNIVQILDVSTGTVMRTETVVGNDYIYTYAKNVADNVPYNRGAQRTFKVAVRVLDTLGRQSDAVTITVENPPPALVIPTLTSGVECFYVTYVAPTDPDYQGVFIWSQDNADYDPIGTTPTYQGSNNFITLPGSLGATYYVRLAAYDSFSTSGLNISPPMPVVVSAYSPDTQPPPVPTGLALSPSLVTLPTGEVQEILTANWDPIDPLAVGGDQFAYFDVEIQQGTSQFVSYQTQLTTYTWTGLIPNQNYTVQIRSISKSSYASNFCTAVSTTMPPKNTPPGPVTGFTAQNSLKSVFLLWTNPTDPDLDHIEIWMSNSASFASASLAGTSYGTAFTITGLATGVQKWFWLRSVNTSDIQGALVGPQTCIPGAVTNQDISAGSITADRIVAGTITGNLLDINTSIPASITIGSSGVAIGDPAALINHNATTQISAGLIQISGATTLANWTDGGDNTKIAGGSIAANTISANQLSIGLRNVTISGLKFTFTALNQTLSWTAGTIGYYADTGAFVTVNVTAGSFLYSGSPVFVTWTKDATSLVSLISYAADANKLLFATYSPANGLIVTYGRTLIDGSSIVTGSVTASQIAAGSITADRLQAGSITATQIAAGAITAGQIAAGSITADRLVANSITSAQIATGAITAATIASGAVGGSAIAVGSITGTLIANGAITTAKIAANSITAALISVTSLSALSANVGNLTAGTIQSSDGRMVMSLDAGYIVISD